MGALSAALSKPRQIISRRLGGDSVPLAVRSPAMNCCTCSRPLMAQMRHADALAQCPVTAEKQT